MSNFTYTVDGGNATLTAWLDQENPNVVIPDTIDGYPVVSWDYTIFQNNQNIHTLQIGNNVLEIPSNGIISCTLLRSIIIGTGVTKINAYAFLGVGITGITIPSNVTYIDSGAFNSCLNLTTITIPDTVTQIGSDIFQACTALTTAIINLGGNNVNLSSSFLNCTSLTTLIINALSATSMGSNICKDCTALTTVNINAPVGDYMFSGCTNLVNLTLGSNVTIIGEEAFKNCTSLSNITLPEGLIDIKANAFYNLPLLNKINIPTTVQNIYASIFANCYNLYSIYFDGDVPSGTVDVNAFSSMWQCYGYYFSTYTYPSSLGGLTMLVFPYTYDITDSEVYITSYTNAYGVNPQYLALPDFIEGYPVVDIGVYFASATYVNTLVLGNYITSLVQNAFYGNYVLTTVKIPDSVTSIGDNAFYNCANLLNIIIPVVPTIGTNAFYQCTKLKMVVIKDCASIGNSAFYGCSDLDYFAIPHSCASIGDYAFYNCANLYMLIYEGDLPTFGSGVFSNTLLGNQYGVAYYYVNSTYSYPFRPSSQDISNLVAIPLRTPSIDKVATGTNFGWSDASTGTMRTGGGINGSGILGMI